MSDDDRAVMERLAALEAEVKADAVAKQARREVALAKVREQRAVAQSEKDALRTRQTELVSKKPRATPPPPARDDDDEDRESSQRDDFGNALALARRAQDVKQELTKTPKQGDKSWVKSALASTMLGPIGWLYAGSLREAVPGAAAWLAFAALATKLPWILLFPVLLVAMPLSGIAGLLYAVQYNRKGSRQRLFGDKAAKKQLAAGPGRTK
ncbi:hypothetical protein BH11MYX3_BH11MYX3_16780 [soil metagenome]